MNDFEIMNEMSSKGMDIRMTGNIITADKVKQGGKITVGVDESTFNLIINQMATNKTTHYVALYVVNKAQYEEVKKAGKEETEANKQSA